MLSTERRPSTRRGRIVSIAVVIAILLTGAATVMGYVPYLSARRVRLDIPQTCPPPIVKVFGRTWEGFDLVPPSWVPSIRGEFRILSLHRASFTADGHRGAMDFFVVDRHHWIAMTCPLQ